MKPVRFWRGLPVIRMSTDQKLTLRPLGIYLFGYDLERLEWALATTRNPIQIAAILEPLRSCSQILSLLRAGGPHAAHRDATPPVRRSGGPGLYPVLTSLYDTSRVFWCGAQRHEITQPSMTSMVCGGPDDCVVVERSVYFFMELWCG